MPATWDSFERYKQRGLDARSAGQHAAARVYFLEASRAMLELSKQAQTDDLRSAREQTARRLLELARSTANEKSPPSSEMTRVPNEIDGTGEAGEKQAADWAIRERPTTRLADVAGLDEAKNQILLKMVYPFAHADLAKKFNIKAGGGVLLYGPPGTGKTLLARATAGELDATFFRISAADVLSKWVGEAEQNIAKLFTAARQEKRAVIFIDEIEALIPARRDDGSSVMQRVVPQILQGMEGFDGAGASVLFLGATNLPWQLDPAVLRPGRFDEKIYVPLPDAPARQKLLEINLAHRPLADDVDLQSLAPQLDGYSGADIKYIADQAAVVPFLRSVAGGSEQAITQAILEDIIRQTPRSVSRQQCERFEEWGGMEDARS